MSAGRGAHGWADGPIFCPALNPDEIVDELARSRALSLPLLSDAFRLSLVQAARASRFRPARAQVGKGEHRVYQRMEVCEQFPADSIFRTFTDEFQRIWDAYQARVPSSPFEGRLIFNDLMLQRYSIGEVGITPHRDRTAYRNLVCLFILEGAGRFYVCDDRGANGAREIPHAAGDVLLMRAPGFLGCDERPFHFVRDIQSPRYVFGLRHERH